MRPIDADNLMEYCNNQKSRAIDCNDIARFPTLDVKPVIKGKWIRYPKFCKMQCSKCGQKYRTDFAPKNYCPNCGADMREVEE